MELGAGLDYFSKRVVVVQQGDNNNTRAKSKPAPNSMNRLAYNTNNTYNQINTVTNNDPTKFRNKFLLGGLCQMF